MEEPLQPAVSTIEGDGGSTSTASLLQSVAYRSYVDTILSGPIGRDRARTRLIHRTPNKETLAEPNARH